MERLRACGPDGREVTTSWRRQGRSLHVDGPGGPIELVHDRAGRLVEHRRGGVVVGRWTWDAAGRRTSFTGPGGEEVRYVYDDAGRPARAEGTAFGTLVYERDGAGRLREVRGEGLSQWWEYDDAGRVTGYRAARPGRAAPEGRPARPGPGAGRDVGAAQTLAWDGAGHLVRAGTPEGEVSYTYDDAGQLTGVDGPGGRASYAYDVAGRLTAVERVGADGVSHREVFAYDAAGQLVSRTGEAGRTRYFYDAAGRRARESGPAGERTYSWAPTGHLVGVTGPDGDGAQRTASIERDALGLPVAVGGTAVSWDLAGPLPAPCSLGGEPVSLLPGAGAVGDVLVPTGARAVRSGLEADPWGLPALLARDGAAGVDVSGALRVGVLELLGARAYDPATMSFLSTDPLTRADAAPWAANPYSYAGNNPVALSDPLGLRPLTDDELNAYNDAHTGWHAAWSWVKDNKDYLIGGALVIAGGIAAATGFGGPLGTMLIGAGADMIIQRATTGSVNYIEVAVSGLLGAAGGAGGSALAGRLGLKGVWAAAASGAGAGALPGGTMSGYSYMSGPGPHTPAGFLQATATETLKGGVTGGLGGAAGHVLTALGRTVLGKLRPQPPAPASAPKFSYSDKVMQQMTEDKYHGFPTILDEIICREGKCTIVPGYFKDPAPGMSDDSANWLFAFEGVVAEAY